MFRVGGQTNTKNRKIQCLMFYQKASLPYHVQKPDWWTKLFATFLPLLLRHLNQLLLGSYSLGKVIILLETVGSAFGLCRKELFFGSQVLQMLIPVEGSGELHSWVPPRSAQALQKMWEFYSQSSPLQHNFSIKILRALLYFLINSNIVLPFANYNMNETGRCNTR